MLRNVQGEPAYLPVITVITDATGLSLTPAKELRIMPSLVATFVKSAGDGPDRIELSVLAAAPTEVFPLIVPVQQPAIAAETVLSGGNTRNYLAYASLAGPSYITGVMMIAAGSLAQDPTNFCTFKIWDIDSGGAHYGAALYSGTTETGGSGATGSWVPGTEAFSVGLGYEIASEHSLAIEWDTSSGSGVNMPGGWFRVT